MAAAPWDRELVLAFGHLRARGFVPPPLRELPPAAAAARTFASWQPEDRAALAAELVTLPEPAETPDRAWSALELLLRIPGEAERARQLIQKLEARSDPRGPERAPLAVARFRAAALAGVELGRRVADLRAAGDAAALGEGLRRAAVEALETARRGQAPHGHAWLVSVCDGTEIANLTLAFARRPALARELERLADWTAQAGPGPVLAAAEAADAAGDFARGTELLTLALAQYGTPDDAERALAARRELLADGARRAFPAPERLAPEPIRSGWETRLLVLGSTDPSLPTDATELAPSPEDLALLEAIGEHTRAARGYLARRDPHALRFADLLPPADLFATFGKSPDDELAIAADPRPALAAFQVLPPGAAKQLLGLRLVGARVAIADDAPAADPANLPSDDPHHPDNRLAAASDLLAAGQTAAGATVLAALIRKADATSNRRLFEVVAQALEAEDPEVELVTAAQRVLADDQRAPLLLTALHGNPTAAYALHEALLAAALDASRRDRDRLLALETWLRIWTATGTAPDPASIQTLRRDEPTLLAVAAVRVGTRGGRSGTPLADAMAFLAEHPPAVTAPDVFSDGLLALAQ